MSCSPYRGFTFEVATALGILYGRFGAHLHRAQLLGGNLNAVDNSVTGVSNDLGAVAKPRENLHA